MYSADWVVVFQASPNSTCPEPVGYGPIKMLKSVCGENGGAWNGNPADTEEIDCYLNWCTAPGLGMLFHSTVPQTDVICTVLFRFLVLVVCNIVLLSS